jgi:hypothetical protein
MYALMEAVGRDANGAFTFFSDIIHKLDKKNKTAS